MNLTSRFASDWRVWDNVEAVTYEKAMRSVAPFDSDPLLQKPLPVVPFDPAAVPDTGVYQSIPVAKRRKLSVRELAVSGGAYTGRDRVWFIPRTFLADAKPGDVVVADQERWTVMEEELGKFGQTWRLTTRDLTVSYDLRDVVNIERPQITYDAAGAPIMLFPSGPAPNGGEVLYPSLVCKVQPTTQEIAEERGIRGTAQSYDVIVSRQIAVCQYDRIAWTAGTQTVYLDILKLENPQSIMELPKIQAVRKV